MARVLIVEDDPDIAVLLRLLLEGEGYRVDWCACGRPALAHVQATVPQVILVDVQLPDVDGIELARQWLVDPRLDRTAIIVMSAAIEPKGAVEALGLSFIAKPFDLSSVVQTIRRAVAE
jgi:DNA-binding response OmpR family regulator